MGIFQQILGIPEGNHMGVYTNWIMDLLSQDNYKLKKENEQLKEMIRKFVDGESTRKELVKEFQLFINNKSKENNN